MRDYQTKLKEKLKEALSAVLPIVCIVLLLSFTIAPIPTGILILFLFGAVLLIAGMMFFTLGAELSMTPVGEKVGARMAKTNRLWLTAALAFVLGFIITISEPDLQVLAEQVPAVPNLILILAVAVGVGLFLVVAVLRMLFSKSLNKLLIVFYVLVFAIAFFAPEDFLAVAFDSGGVTTGVDDRPVHHGARRRLCRRAKRQARRKRQFRPCGAVLQAYPRRAAARRTL